MGRITLLTDFGTRDGYVGAMKGVMASIFPGVITEDVSHDIAPGDVEGAALALLRYWDRYPSGTVHTIVVDPGVGTDRRALAVEADRRFLVAPDNGVLSRVIEAAGHLRMAEVRNPAYTLPDPSHTFHGRDIFAPAAAYLAQGIHLFRLGPSIDDPVRVGEPEVREEDDALVGEVVSLDRFGNLVTNLSGAALGDWSGVEVAGRAIPAVRTYGEVAPREMGAVVNSDGRLEVAARDTSAAEVLDAQVGTRVKVRRAPGGPAADPAAVPA